MGGKRHTNFLTWWLQLIAKRGLLSAQSEFSIADSHLALWVGAAPREGANAGFFEVPVKCGVRLRRR